MINDLITKYYTNINQLYQYNMKKYISFVTGTQSNTYIHYIA